MTDRKYNCKWKGKAPFPCHDYLWSDTAPLNPSVCLSLLQLCLQRAWALGLWLEANRGHSSQQILKTRVCSDLLHTAQWPRERDAKIKWFLVRPTKKRHGASDIPTVLRETGCDQQHTSTCVREYNFPNFDFSCNRKDFLWNLFRVQ